MAEWNIVATTLVLPEAHMMKSRLEAEGIACFLSGDLAASVAGVPTGLTANWNQAPGGISVHVPSTDAEQARQILAETREHCTRERRIESPLRRVFQLAVTLYFAGIAGFVGWKIYPLLGAAMGMFVLILLLRVAFKPTYY